MRSTLIAAILVAVSNANGCGDLRPSTLPDPGPGTCNDVGKCCDWTWPPAFTSVVSCDTTIPGSCYGCKAPSCCCEAGLMVLTDKGDIHVASCCDYFYADGTICNDMPENCTPKAKLCKEFGKADCDLCGARCITFFDDEPSINEPQFIE